jgi:hypothetical protein
MEQENKNLTQGGSVGVRINECESHYFLTGKGLRQGDPLSPLLFNFVGDVFTRMLVKAAQQNLISGLLWDFRPGGVLFYNMQTTHSFSLRMI